MTQITNQLNAFSGYRFHFNGKETDNELYGEGNVYDYGFRIYNPRLGRFLSVDPLSSKYPFYTPYQFSSNNPIVSIDIDGKEGDVLLNEAERQGAWIVDVVNSGMQSIRSGLYSLFQSGSTNNGSTRLTQQTTPKIEVNEHEKVHVNTQQNTPHQFNINDARAGIKAVYEKYGATMAATVEKMYRFETNHFKSKQYKETGTPGMEVHGAAPSYGWGGQEFFDNNPEYKPEGTTGMYENKGLSGSGGNAQVKGKQKEFIVMPSVEAGMMYLADYIIRNNGNYARWFSTDPKKQELYKQNLEGIIPRITNEIETKKKLKQ
jgi:RHS repeat-associated protein